MATLAELVRGFTPPTKSALADPIKQHFKTLPAQTAANLLRQRQTIDQSLALDQNGIQVANPQALKEFMAEVPGVAAMLAPARYVGKILKGMPDLVKVGNKLEQFGTDQRLVDIAKNYSANKGIIYNPQTKYAELDRDRANNLAIAYQNMIDNPNNPAVKKSYNALIDESMAQYEALRKKGYKFDFIPESGDLYGNPRNAINDVVTNKHLSVFPTQQGFGGASAAQASETNPMLMRTGEKWNGQDVTANDLFRAVHDVFGHAKHGVGFRATGEENAFLSHARMFSPEALPALASETRGQNSWVNFGPYGQKNINANPLLTEYAEQKTGLLPSWAWKEGLFK